MARSRSREWHTKVVIAAKKVAKAEASGLRSPKSDLHLRSAERLRQLCASNGGVYVKLGQLISQMDFVFPREYIEVLGLMLDQVSCFFKGDIDPRCSLDTYISRCQAMS